MDIWFTLGSVVGYAVGVIIAGLILWSIYGFLKKIKNKIIKN